MPPVVVTSAATNVVETSESVNVIVAAWPARRDAAELERAKKYLRGAYIVSAETNGAQASRMGRYELNGLGQDFGDRLLERIAAVTPEEIRNLAESWFGPHVLAAIRPDDASLARLAEEGEPDPEELFEPPGTEEEEPE